MKIFHGNFRRVVIGFFLSAAFVMLVLGLTLLANSLSKQAFLIYWLICFLLTGLAAILALMEMIIIRRELRREQAELIKTTLEEAEMEARKLRRADPEQ